MAQVSRTVPERMRAIAIDRLGGPEALTMHTLPVTVPGASEVLIAVHTAEVGGWDADMRGGWSMSGKKPHFPLVLGGGGSGTVAAVGSRVRRFKIGDPAYAYAWDNPKGGFYAEYVAAPAETAAPVPAPLDLAQAGAIPIAALTAIQGIDDALHLKKGERLIILGASGGLGVFAIQFAKLRGARVLAIASGADGVALARKLGADAAIDGRDGDVAGAARAFAPDGVDAIVAFTGGKALTTCLDTLRRGGRLAYPNGIEPVPKKRRGIRTNPYDGIAGRTQWKRLPPAITAGRRPGPHPAAFPLSRARRAPAGPAPGPNLGQVVLRISQ